MLKRILLICIATCWLLICLLSVCFAAEAVPTFGDLLADFLQSTVFPILGALTLGFVSWGLKKIGTKYHLEGLLSNNAFLMQLAVQAVAFAEEKAANLAKQSKTLTGSDKLNAAIAYIMQHSPKVSEAQAQSVVTAALASISGVGATKETAIGQILPPAVPGTPS